MKYFHQKEKKWSLTNFQEKWQMDKWFYMYCPVSVLVITNRVPEDIHVHVLANQSTVYFNDILCKFLCAFKEKDVDVRMCFWDFMKTLNRPWKKECMLDALPIDLSKAFDCLPHKLLLAKLHAYGLSTTACSLFRSYLSNKFQGVKIEDTRSDWLQTLNRVPQGPVLGSILFNIFINDKLYSLT